MYMDILEQEVEHLSAEVMRLRLMVHRVTQSMEAPLPDPHHRSSHVDPRQVAPLSKATSSGTPKGLQVTLDSYKEILPLAQLLLAQQQQQQRNDAEVSHGRRRRQPSRHHRHPSRHLRPAASRRAGSSSSRSSPCAAPSRSQSQRSSDAPLTISSSHIQGNKPTRFLSHTNAGPARTSSPSLTTTSSSPTLVVLKKDGHGKPTKPALAQGQGDTLFAGERSTNANPIHVAPTREEPPSANATAPTPIATSVVSRLRAQRQQEAANEQERTPDRSNVMPMATSPTRSATTSPSRSEVRRTYVMNATTVASPRKKVAPATEPAAAASLPHQSASITSSKRQLSPSEQEAERRAAWHSSEGTGQYSLSTFPPGCEAPGALSESPVSSKRASLQAGSLQYGSAASSIIHSEQGIYNYSALSSAYNSPALSHVPEDATAATRAVQAASTPSPAPSAQAPSSQQRHNQLGLQTSALSPAQEYASSSSSTSEESTEGDAAELQKALHSVIPSPYRAGVILGGRQPISVQSMNFPSAFVTASTMACAAGSNPAAAAMLGRGDHASAASRANLLQALRPIPSDSSASTSSSSNIAAFCHPSLRQSTEAHHRDSSFHNYSDSASSQPSSQNAGTRFSEESPAGPYTSQSQDAYSLASYSLQHSIQRSSRRKSSDASQNSSRALSHFMCPPQLAQSVSLGTSSVGHLGSISAGGYYYGYNLGLGSPSQRSLALSPTAEA
ncbi:hypothetical protein LdCL_360067300 [Leishmania donovani]|uniref:Uncharacterized protein n=1 Tax=Leishmania donovani TaxID=5661 RepID=A0A3S7XBV2_LEIDO|nr:hypothetical protein LdCL_360067300 [Leishmania donovani]